MIRGTVCRNLERRSGRMAAGCAKVNGITGKGSQISPATCKFLSPAPAATGVLGARRPSRRWGGDTAPPHRGSELLLPCVVLLAVHPRALPILRPLHTALLSSADPPIGCRVGLLAIDVGLSALQ